MTINSSFVVVMLLQLGNFDLLPLLLNLFRLGLLDWISVVQSVVLTVQVNLVALLRLSLAVVVNFEESALDLFAVHFHESLLGAFMGFVLYVGEPFRLFRLPVECNADCFDFAEATEPVTDVIFLESVGQPLYEQSVAIGWHQLGHF